MPELPEVETVRAGLAAHVLGRTVVGVEARGERALRRSAGGGAELERVLVGARPSAAVRRGKYLWLLLDRGANTPEDAALLMHLGMSGQLLVRGAASCDPQHPHLRVRLRLADGGALDFVDQRTFGHLGLDRLVPAPDGLPGGHGAPDAMLPEGVVHIARDLLDPRLDRAALARRLRARRTGVKRALLDQRFVSGVGNIYADEALWHAGVHPERSADRLTPTQAEAVLGAAHDVMVRALAQGGTSFDGLYVDTTGRPGYFERSLAVYGREGDACLRCGAAIVRLPFASRSSHVCPRCQVAPRRRAGGRAPR